MWWSGNSFHHILCAVMSKWRRNPQGAYQNDRRNIYEDVCSCSNNCCYAFGCLIMLLPDPVRRRGRSLDWTAFVIGGPWLRTKRRKLWWRIMLLLKKWFSRSVWKSPGMESGQRNAAENSAATAVLVCFADIWERTGFALSVNIRKLFFKYRWNIFKTILTFLWNMVKLYQNILFLINAWINSLLEIPLTYPLIYYQYKMWGLLWRTVSLKHTYP